MLKDWLKLHCTKTISVAQKRALVKYFHTAGNIFAADERSLRQCNLLSSGHIERILDWKKHINEEIIESDMALLQSLHGDYVSFTDARFPSLLNEIQSPPLGLFTIGNTDLFNMPQIAVVGSRSASPGGKKTARKFSAELGQAGFTITSGLALGIDSHAHKGGLSHSRSTLAVTATGIDRVYPKSNRDLFYEIAANGLIATEFPPGTQPLPGNFPQRNRIISGLSLGTLVVEAGIRSGSLITARLAAEQGREVYAVPGSIYMPTSRGCHSLIRQGAKLVETIDDILDELGHFNQMFGKAENNDHGPKATGRENALYNLIDYAPTSIEEIIEQSGLTAEQVSSILVDMELEGLIVETHAGYQRSP